MNIERLLSIFWMLGKSAKRGHHGAIFLSTNLKNKDHKSCSTTIDKKRLRDAENVQFCTKKTYGASISPRPKKSRSQARASFKLFYFHFLSILDLPLRPFLSSGQKHSFEMKPCYPYQFKLSHFRLWRTATNEDLTSWPEP